MKIKKLISITMRNFKGIVDRVINFDGDTNIYGANESGKSSIYTAFNWVLTGKDEFDRKDYEIKNTVRKELNSQAHEVEVVLSVNDREIKLKRAYLENWKKPKGQSTKVFDGHYTDFYVNDFTCSATEYQSRVDEVIPANIIKLITNPGYFNSLKWDEQRRGLIAIAGEISHSEIFDAITTSENDYSVLINELNNGKTIDQWKKELNAKKLMLKKAATEYVPRIDEAKRNKPLPENWAELQKEIASKTKDVEAIEELLNDASKALQVKQKGLRVLQNSLFEKESALSAIRQKVKTTFLAGKTNGSADIALVEQEISALEKSIEQLNKTIADNATNKTTYENSIAAKNETIKSLRADWDKINAERFVFDDSKCECPTCKQALPAAEIEAKKAELLKNFNESVLNRKNAKVTESNQVKAEIKQLEANITAIDEQTNLTETLAQKQTLLDETKIKLAGLKGVESKKVVVDVEAAVNQLMSVNADALNLNDEIKELNTKITSETATLDGDTDNAAEITRKSTLQTEIKALEKKLAVKETIENTDKRIAQLETEETANAQKIADLEQQEFEVESFTRAHMDILEKRVNGMFKYVSFRLFQKLVNGGIEETCVCEYKGVPYPTLNTAARLLAGLDVCDTLSNYYDIHAPIFCDNRESVTHIPDTESQIISLFVSPEDSEIRINNVSEASVPSITKNKKAIQATAFA